MRRAAAEAGRRFPLAWSDQRDKSVVSVREFECLTLVKSAVSESDTFELEADLPAEQGQDRWYANPKDGIGNYDRDKILSEVIAFANSIGEMLFLGVAESDDSPPTASALNPIPRCTKLAMRLEQQAGSCIEPQIPGLQSE